MKKYGIHVDGFSLDVDEQLTEAGIILKLDDNGQISRDVVDTIIFYKNRNIKVILEVPYTINPNSSLLCIMANNLHFDLSLLPPPDLSDKNDKLEYTNRLEAYCREWLTTAEANFNIYPISGFIQYLCNRELGYVPDNLTDDEYIDNNFVKNVDMDAMDEIKNSLETCISECFGGDDSLAAFIHTAASRMINKLEHPDFLVH